VPCAHKEHPAVRYSSTEYHDTHTQYTTHIHRQYKEATAAAREPMYLHDYSCRLPYQNCRCTLLQPAARKSTLVQNCSIAATPNKQRYNTQQYPALPTIIQARKWVWDRQLLSAMQIAAVLLYSIEKCSQARVHVSTQHTGQGCLALDSTHPRVPLCLQYTTGGASQQGPVPLARLPPPDPQTTPPLRQ
jgi:hypothetical protein